MSTLDFLRLLLGQMIDLRHSLTVLFKRLLLAAVDTVVAPKLANQAKSTTRLAGDDFVGSFDGKLRRSINPASRPCLPLGLMVGLLYLKNSFNLSDEDLVQR